MPPYQPVTVAKVPSVLLVECTGEAPPSALQIEQAITRYPVNNIYAEYDAGWEAWLKEFPDQEAAEGIRSLIKDARNWEARFLLMSDKYMAQTDYLGLCNGRLKNIGKWNEEAEQTVRGTPP